jgi:cytochrome P450
MPISAGVVLQARGGGAVAVFSPFDPAYDEDPFPVLEDMRRHCPVGEAQPGLHVAAGHEDCVHLMREWHDFSSRGGGTLATDLPAEAVTVNAIDGHDHVRLRRVLQSVLRPTNFRAESEWIADRALEQIENSADPGRGIFMGDFYSGRIPHPSVDAFNDYLQRLIDERRKGLEADDLVARVVRFRDEDDRSLTDKEIRSQLTFLLIAGNHTTANLIGSLLSQLVTDPELYQRLRRDRRLVEPAIEETLRMQSPVQGVFRTVAGENVELHGVSLEEGHKVMAHLQSANRDAAVFEDPDSFDVERSNLDRHIAFGYGAHFCIGAPLARLETKHALSAVLDRVERIELQPGADIRIWTRSMVNRGPRSLPVLLTVA